MDDFIFSGTALFMDNIVKSLNQKFKVSAEGKNRFTYIDLQIDQIANYIKISQKQDNDIKPTKIPDDVAMTNPLDKIQQCYLKSLAGKLNWIITHSRPQRCEQNRISLFCRCITWKF